LELVGEVRATGGRGVEAEDTGKRNVSQSSELSTVGYGKFNAEVNSLALDHHCQPAAHDTEHVKSIHSVRAGCKVELTALGGFGE
jgi:hypothetical protein